MGSYFFTVATGCNSSLTILQLIFDMHLFSFAFIVSYIAATQPNCIAIIERSVARLNLIWNKSCNCRCCWTTFFTYCKIKDFSVDNSKVKSLINVREVKRLCETERERYSFTLPRGEICKYDHVAGIALMLQMFSQPWYVSLGANLLRTLIWSEFCLQNWWKFWLGGWCNIENTPPHLIREKSKYIEGSRKAITEIEETEMMEEEKCRSYRTEKCKCDQIKKKRRKRYKKNK